MHTLDQYRGTLVACRYSLPSSLTHREALETQVVRSQPHMQVGVIGEYTKRPVYVHLDHIDLRNHVD